MKRERRKKSWNEVVKEDMKKRGLWINDVKRQKQVENGDATVEECSTTVYWEEGLAIKAERRRLVECHK